MSALERLGMSHRIHHYPSQQSGGQQQRFAKHAERQIHLFDGRVVDEEKQPEQSISH